MKPLRPFFVPEGGRAGPFPRPSESRGMKNSQRPAPAEAVGCIMTRYGKPKRKFGTIRYNRVRCKLEFGHLEPEWKRNRLRGKP